MSKRSRPRAVYDTRRIVRDMAEKGWMATDLAREAGVSDMTVSRFLNGHTQTERTADLLARALGHQPVRYIRGVVEAVA